MERQKIIESIKDIVKKQLMGEGTGHDWWHTLRVYNMAKNMATQEKANMFIVEISALIHDLYDWKFYGEEGQIRKTGKLLNEFIEDEKEIEIIMDIIMNISFKGGTASAKQNTLEGKIVQDADRLDALGAIGIGRAFAYGGHKNREMYNPNMAPMKYSNLEEYKNSKGHTINHFYEKLLLLKDKMNTQTGKKMAKERHEFMENFLEQFYKEWDGEK
ncbi:HD domain-containing protein [Anaeromicrobium sediminis]|uniref:Phosphohydrolase n=1 Tax=Anaeromicrobium sediminis TaxID=1478221 RepID=A0A267MJB7_9FIRM|nr:HD domain-containing protein [Anaeromicrobium sediminis]PAB59008.1 phosphohydrolase [Anaeromicrobium sediminis]